MSNQIWLLAIIQIMQDNQTEKGNCSATHKSRSGGRKKKKIQHLIETDGIMQNLKFIYIPKNKILFHALNESFSGYSSPKNTIQI
jgi:hypothetical protein